MGFLPERTRRSNFAVAMQPTEFIVTEFAMHRWRGIHGVRLAGRLRPFSGAARASGPAPATDSFRGPWERDLIMAATTVKRFLYFSYGSNMSTKRIHKNCRAAEFFSKARLPGYEMRFAEFGFGGSWGGATGTLAENAAAETWGVLWSIPVEPFMEALDRFVHAQWLAAGHETFQHSSNAE